MEVRSGTGKKKKADWHIISCEYPPSIGGLADHTFQVAHSLSSLGLQIVVWAPGQDPVAQTENSFSVQSSFGRFRLEDLAAAGRLLNRFAGPRRILLQWTPTGYGLKSSNLPFCLWLAWRVLFGDQLCVIFHEAFFDWSERPLKRKAAAVVQRVMAFILVNAATQTFVSTTRWGELLRPYCFRDRDIKTLPVPANLLPGTDGLAVLRTKLSLAPDGQLVLGHFGLYSPGIEPMLIPCVLNLLRLIPDMKLVLIGGGSSRYLEAIRSSGSELASRVHATGECSHEQASLHISACDAMLQPYPDGITTRRGSTMAALSHAKYLISNGGPNTERLWATASGVHLLPLIQDPQSAASEVAAVLADRERLVTLGKQGAAYYQEHFALSHTIDGLLSVA